ncbi:MAG: hypothetical protein MI749_07700 [Desulfovibrionales bacterium]|nr:hypothetical protein [Desulfovibrionales bacterium]
MSPYLLPLGLQLLGLAVIVMEIFIPSLGLLSLMAASLMGYSLYLVFTEISKNAGLAFLAADLVLVPILIFWAIKLLARSPLSLQDQLSQKKGVTAQPPELMDWKGKEGITLTDLRPSGTAMIDGHRLDVVSDGEYIEKEIPIKVVRVTGNQILVSHKET